jgi:uncharacterized protein (TIGR02145 family)
MTVERVVSDNIYSWEDAGKKLKSASGWNEYRGNSGNGSDDFGFSALPGGCYLSRGEFNGGGNYGYWWTATEKGVGKAYETSMVCTGDNVGEMDIGYGGRSVRCVAD